MNKPDWKDAPEWANYLAMDENGEWFWYKQEPIANAQRGIWQSNDSLKSTHVKLQWGNTLEEKPHD